MTGSAFSVAVLTASSVPSAALTITDEVVFSGIYVIEASRPQ